MCDLSPPLIVLSSVFTYYFTCKSPMVWDSSVSFPRKAYKTRGMRWYMTGEMEVMNRLTRCCHPKHWILFSKLVHVWKSFPNSDWHHSFFWAVSSGPLSVEALLCDLGWQDSSTKPLLYYTIHRSHVSEPLNTFSSWLHLQIHILWSEFSLTWARCSVVAHLKNNVVLCKTV